MDRVLRLVIVRHGHVEGIEPERFRGRTDLPLTKEGEAQAGVAAKRVARHWRPAAIYTSPLRRCIVTGAAISRACGVAAKVLETLNDINYGAWQWKTPAEVRERWPHVLEEWYAHPERVRVPAGESLQDVALRVSDALRMLREAHAGQTVVLVTHDTTIRVILLDVLGMPLSKYRALAQDPCAINEVTLAEGSARAERINWTPL